MSLRFATLCRTHRTLWCKNIRADVSIYFRVLVVSCERDTWRFLMFRLFCVLSLLVVLAGCAPSIANRSGKSIARSLSPTEYQLLPDAEKVRYKNIVVRVPDTWGGVSLPYDIGPYSSAID